MPDTDPLLTNFLRASRALSDYRASHPDEDCSRWQSEVDQLESVLQSATSRNAEKTGVTLQSETSASVPMLQVATSNIEPKSARATNRQKHRKNRK
jgi:hypothetical protein